MGAALVRPRARSVTRPLSAPRTKGAPGPEVDGGPGDARQPSRLHLMNFVTATGFEVSTSMVLCGSPSATSPSPMRVCFSMCW